MNRDKLPRTPKLNLKKEVVQKKKLLGSKQLTFRDLKHNYRLL